MDNTILDYEIIEKVGEGGMGEIYKALDTKLDRFVALKFLPPRFSDSEEEKKRFIKEAKTASALNHPNICTIYGIHEYQDPSGDKHSFIAMEYLEGRTLRNLSKDLSIKEIINIGIQIAEGLSAAHEKGIIHRDIKPENIMIRKEGRIQIMDFGLAKLNSSNYASRITKIGSTMGTLSYMSPEQVQGLDVDFRTDIFSFGIVLFELLTGDLPFKGVHEAAVIYKIVNEEASPVSKIKSNIDPLFDDVIRKCLEKDKEKRYGSSKELLEDLKNIKSIFDEEKGNGISKERRKLVKTGTQKISSGFKWNRNDSAFPSSKIIWGIFTAGIVFITIYYLFFSNKPVNLNPEMRIEELTISFTDISIPSMSADGNWIAFPASDQNDKWDIYLMHSSVRQPRRVTNDFSPYIHYANISPDGGFILYNLGKDLYIIPSVGGIEKKVAENVIASGWRPDGKQIGFVREHYPKSELISFWTMNIDGSNKKLTFKDRWKINGRFSFSYSPDGYSIVRSRFFDSGFDELFIRNLITGEEKQLTFDKSNIEDQKWTDEGVVLYSSNKSGNMNIWAIPANGGKTIQITKGNGPDLEISASSDLKNILYYQLRDFSNIWIDDLIKSKYQQITFDERLITDPAFSPDQKRIAFSLHKPAPEPNTQIFIMEKDGSNLRQVTFDNSKKKFLIFSPDGKYLAFTQYSPNNADDIGKTFLINIEKPEPPEFLGIGKAGMWIDNTSLVLIENHFTEKISIDRIKREKIYKDSTLAFPVAADKFIFYCDLHYKNSGKYYLVLKSGKNNSPAYLFSSENFLQVIVNQNYAYMQNINNEIWRYNFISGRKEKMGYFTNLMNYWGLGFNVSNDDKDLIYLEHKRSTKFVMIENSFLK